MEDIEEREDAGTPQIIQKIRASLAFWIKEYIGYKTISIQEHKYTKRALQRLLPNPNICVLGNTTETRQPIISFLIYTSSNELKIDDDTTTRDKDIGKVYQSREFDNNGLDKPLHGPFVAKLLNDLFGIQARGGCACAGPYAHSLLHIDRPLSLAFRSAVQKVSKYIHIYVRNSW